MGVLDYLWPFEKKFSEIPCAREAGIAGMVGGIGTGASSIIIFNTPRYAYKTSIFSGFAIFWVTFIVCGIEQRKAKAVVDKLKSGEID